MHLLIAKACLGKTRDKSSDATGIPEKGAAHQSQVRRDALIAGVRVGVYRKLHPTTASIKIPCKSKQVQQTIVIACHAS